MLYGYGGFNVSLTPAYTAQALAWVAAGGVWAVANLRGGSEHGEEWHRAGHARAQAERVRRLRRRRRSTWSPRAGRRTSSSAVMGGSNGGLLVGATLTQRPDLAAAVVCSAPLLDMVRYERFGLGRTWNDEYGTAEDPTELGWLLGYSPYHAVREGTAYPAVLFTTFESDTRVAPAARPQAGRRAAARDDVGGADRAAPGDLGRARRPGGQPHGRTWPPTSSPSSPRTPVSLPGADIRHAQLDLTATRRA